MNDHDLELKAMQAKLRVGIQRIADTLGISYEEAARKAVLTIDGKKIKPINVLNLTFTVEPENEKDDNSRDS